MTAPEEPNHVWDLEDDFEEDLPSWRDIEHPDARMSDDEEDTQLVYNPNFGQQPFAYTAPSGYLPLNTYNI